ncbi:hypothetical protein [Acidovorax sp. NCPPB 3576]|uniref:hypothetical protein n=1 Tax=Acidovorax sp. NCPPB 3576 TaxID=2940488 RepID=UPI00234B7112|nr:hypothetical protein [Acidovorax sp. NCPPB 3576]WCM86676.1 hypothetical protein M5C98_14945 [Acidovorax sp. NCPPB 3576]
MGVHKFPIDRPDSGNDEPPHNAGMEDRVKTLEQFAFEANGRLARIETTLDHVNKEVSQFKWWVAGSAVAIILSMIAAVLGTGVAIQQMTVATFQGAAQVAKESAPVAAPQQPIIINVPAAATPAQPAK